MEQTINQTKLRYWLHLMDQFMPNKIELGNRKHMAMNDLYQRVKNEAEKQEAITSNDWNKALEASAGEWFMYASKEAAFIGGAKWAKEYLENTTGDLQTVSTRSQDELPRAARTLIDYLREKFHPHVTALVTSDSVELMEGIVSYPNIEDE